MNILFTTRRPVAQPSNPIALLDLAAYLRGLGHTVDCYYLDRVKPNLTRDKYDLEDYPCYK